MRRRYADLARGALPASAAKRPRHETPALFGRDCNLLLWPEMLREAIGKLWKMLPKAARLRLVRATQTTFTVSVAAIVINEKQEVLLLNHVLRPKSGWGFPGGFLDAGEQTHEAIRREVKEETGIDLEDLRFRRALVRARHVEIIFSARPVGEARVLSSEIYELGWFEFDSLPEGTAFGQKMLIGEVLNSEI